MDIASVVQRLSNVKIWRLVVFMGMAVIVLLALFQCFALPYGRKLFLAPADQGLVIEIVSYAKILNTSESTEAMDDEVNANESKLNNGYDLASDCSSQANREKCSKVRFQFEKSVTLHKNLTENDGSPQRMASVSKDAKDLVNESRSSLLETTVDPVYDSSTTTSILILKRWDKQPMSISQMNSILLLGVASSHSKKPKWSSARDRELMSAKLEIKNAPAISNIPGLSDHVFRNVSMFKRSYELMERVLKVYIYKEGEKPIFHQPKMRGIYASEGWFMKLMETNKKFTVRDPRKAHLFYLPFSSQALRNTIDGQKIRALKDLQNYLKNYVEIIAHKYRFWNKTEGADHFFVACHDWAPRLTSNMGNCIRALCNANAAKGFKIGKDTSLPTTYIRRMNETTINLGGKTPSERHILAFFAGSMHGYLRPILLHYWENKEADMMIGGSMPRDVEGKNKYREYMKSSKYCVCARGYEVHTPRIVEAIFNECVPVIISDNYVPPFFEVLDWEAFSVFVSEKDVLNLRDILLSISDDKYREMHSRVKMVQKHFLWHKDPVKYDLFHMVLHSIWFSRISQMRSR